MRLLAVLVMLATSAMAQAQRAMFRQVLIDRVGVIRWTDTREEVTLFGANYALPSSSDYRPHRRAAGAMDDWSGPYVGWLPVTSGGPRRWPDPFRAPCSRAC